MHFSNELSDEWFKQFAGEARAERLGMGGRESRWTPLRKRVEAWDCAVYGVWLETHLDLARKPARFWDDLEALVQPAITDLFAAPNITEPAAQPVVRQKREPQHPTPQQTRAPAGGYGSNEWSSRL